jgi:glycosyltransferase involved in cell wall biosynthesis
MYKNYKISVCMPCRNEAMHLDKVINNIPDYVDEIVVISNCSNDTTLETAQAISNKVIALEDNRVKRGIGYGFAHMTGFQTATGDIIVGVDADGTYPCESIKDIVDHMDQNDLDFVSCDRFAKGQSSKVPFKLRLGVWLLSKQAHVLYGLKINDILSGMWVMKREIIDQLQITEGDWNLSPQIKINAHMDSKIRCTEYPVVQGERYGRSHQKYLKTGLSHALWILKNRMQTKMARV